MVFEKIFRNSESIDLRERKQSNKGKTMKIKFSGRTLTIKREKGEKAVKNESGLLHSLKGKLNSMGFDLIKKLAYKDGHMVSEYVHYLRARAGTKTPQISIFDYMYNIRDCAKGFNAFENVNFQVDFNIFEKQPHCEIMLKKYEVFESIC
jgi:hypothetical protein